MYFFLILIGILVLIIGVKRNKKEKVTFTKLLERSELDIDDIDLVIGELRMEFSSTILELQKDVMGLSERLDLFTQIGELQVSPKSIKNIEIIPSPEEKVGVSDKFIKLDIENNKNEVSPKVQIHDNENKNSSKISEISKLLDKGFSIDEICEKVQMGRGEILLIKELYLK